MRPQLGISWLGMCLGLVGAPLAARAQIPQGASPAETVVAAVPNDIHAVPPQYKLDGPRLGATFGPTGDVRSQFGWHFEHQIEARPGGPWLVVENVLLAGGLEQRRFIPTATLVFGVRLPNGIEFGLGPSVTIVTPGGFRSSVVAAGGRTFRIDGIQIPLNLAYAFDKDGQRLSVLTGWAVRQPQDYDTY